MKFEQNFKNLQNTDSNKSFIIKVNCSDEKIKNTLIGCFDELKAKSLETNENSLCVDFGKKSTFICKKLQKANFKSLTQQESCLCINADTIKTSEKIVETLKVRPTVIFDMDGVLVDATKSYRVAVQKTFERFAGREISSPEISETKKIGGLNNDWDLTEFLLKKNGFNINKSEIIDYFQEVYGKLADSEDLLVTKEYFEKLSVNFNLAIFTGRVGNEARYTLKKHNLSDFFYPIITMDDVGLERQKPDTLGVELIKERIITSKIYYLGDTIDDMTCAQNSGVVGIGILPPQDKSNDLRNVLMTKKPLTVLEKATEIVEFLAGIYKKQKNLTNELIF